MRDIGQVPPAGVEGGQGRRVVQRGEGDGRADGAEHRLVDDAMAEQGAAVHEPVPGGHDRGGAAEEIGQPVGCLAAVRRRVDVGLVPHVQAAGTGSGGDDGELEAVRPGVHRQHRPGVLPAPRPGWRRGRHHRPRAGVLARAKTSAVAGVVRCLAAVIAVILLGLGTRA